MNDQSNAARDLRTSKGGRAYVAEYFATHLRRHDFARYINDTLAADFACALAQHLSKLRAPVADELPHWEEISAKLSRNETLPPLELFIHENEPGGDAAAPWRDQLAAALASAPVAGEAQPIQITAVAIVRHDDTDCPHLEYTLEGGLYELPDGAELVWASKPLTGDDGQGTVYAAPQASEAVRILFPTHLRKMWSGGEVQAWLDEHQGVAAPKPSAKGSLERYRKWQANQGSGAADLRQAINTFGSKVFKALAAIARADGPDMRKEDDPELIYREPVMGEVVRIRQAYDELSAALSAQPGAQKEHSDA